MEEPTTAHATLDERGVEPPPYQQSQEREETTTTCTHGMCLSDEVANGGSLSLSSSALDAATASTARGMTRDGGGWTLRIKMNATHDFSVTVHPDDTLTQLYDAVSHATGLRHEQQRLIYRGRLLPRVLVQQQQQQQQQEQLPVSPPLSNLTKEDSPTPAQLCDTKVKDIVGLTDGHTIHLVRKEEPLVEAANSTASSSVTTTTTTHATSSSSPGGNATGTLLAALLGAGHATDRRNRRAPSRFREEDWIRPDPGSMEPVQQGLLTLHTMSSSTSNNGNSNTRRFYPGQWIDCRDTVNQWLEATIMAIVDPVDILLGQGQQATPVPSATLYTPTTDPVVSLTDMDGRRRLLLERCDEAESEEQMDGVHYQPRDNNDGVQLLHVHYNSWSVVWDEWIRSDSERIRTFRARTRHSGPHASPSVQTTMSNAPSISFNGGDGDRPALLRELQRAVTTVHNLLDVAMASNPISTAGRPTESRLPWLSNTVNEDEQTTTVQSLQTRRRDLEALAPFLDRLGRTLTDAAPHVAAMAAGMDENDNEIETRDEHPHTLGGLLSLLSRDRQPHEQQSVDSSTAANPNSDVSMSMASSTGHEQTVVTNENDESEANGESEVIISEDPDHRDFVAGFVNTSRGDIRSEPRNASSIRPGSDEITSLLGAYLAAASLGGTANTGAGTEEVDGGGGSSNDSISRLSRGNESGGIEIHIHAVVTTPSAGGSIGIAALTGSGAALTLVGTPISPTATRTDTTNTTTVNTTSPGGLGGLFGSSQDNTSSRWGPRRLRNAAFNVPLPSNTIDDDSGIFAELYSETPEPINPNNPTRFAVNLSSTDSPPTAQPQRGTVSQGDPPVIVATPNRPSRSSRSRIRPTGSNSSVATSTGNSHSSSQSNRSGGLLRRFFRRHSDHEE